MYVCYKCGHEDKSDNKPNYCSKCGQRRKGFINPRALYYHFIGHADFDVDPTFIFIYERVFELLVILGAMAVFYCVVTT